MNIFRKRKNIVGIVAHGLLLLAVLAFSFSSDLCVLKAYAESKSQCESRKSAAISSAQSQIYAAQQMLNAALRNLAAAENAQLAAEDQMRAAAKVPQPLTGWAIRQALDAMKASSDWAGAAQAQVDAGWVSLASAQEALDAANRITCPAC